MKNIFWFLILFFGVLTNTDPLFSQWVLVHTFDSSPMALVASDTNLFAGTSHGGIYLSTDNGTKWTEVDSGVTKTYVAAFAVSGTNLFAGTDGGIFRTTNNGTSWTEVDSGLNAYDFPYALAVSSTTIFAGTYSGVFRSTDNGTSWTAASAGLWAIGGEHIKIYTLAVSGTNLFCGDEGGIFLSMDNGASWAPVYFFMINYFVVKALAVSGTNLFAGTTTGILLSTNNGTSWSAVNAGLTDTVVEALAVSGTNIFAGTYSGVFLSTNNGTSWTAVNSGMTTPSVFAFAVSGTNLFIAGYDGVWRRPLSQMITSVGRPSTDLPTHFNLAQNYPNPFNPSTIISFSLPSRSYVSLKVFDVVGREVATLVNEELSAGNHNRQWNAANISSGVYFYRLQAGSFTETKKLLLLR